MQIVWCGSGWFPVVDAIRERLPPGATIRCHDPARPLAEQLGDANVILPSNARLDAAAIAAPAKLLLIQQPAVGYEAIDLAAARARGVPVCNAPWINSDAMAEAALLLILACARRLPAAQRAFAERQIGVPAGVELRGKTLGLVGFGRSARRLAEVATVLGMEVRSVRSAASRADLHRMLERSDFVSIHCPLTPSSRHLLDREAFRHWKPGASLINCSRGGIVERAALEHALDHGMVGGVGLDVYWDEPWDPGDPLYLRPEVVTLPHVGGSTLEAFGRLADLVVSNIARVVRGELPEHRIS